MHLQDTPAGRLVSFRAADGVGLSGILFSPRRAGTDAVVFLHGNGDSSVFRSSRTNVLARAFFDNGIAFFAFDNRGSGLLHWLKRKDGEETEYLTGGMTQELIRDCRHDIDGALRLVRTLGYRRIHLAGHSTGANKIVLYHYLKPRNPISGYMLLAPGDDTGLYYRALGSRRFERALERCRREIESGRGDRPAPPGWSPFPMSYRSLYDTLDPDGDYNIFPFLDEIERLNLSKKPRFREFASIRKRVLVAYGTEDEFCYGDVIRCTEILREHSGAPARLRTEIFEGADHGFHGRQQDLAESLATFVVAK